MELSKILDIKENEIINRHKEIDNILQENDDLKKKLEVNQWITTPRYYLISTFWFTLHDVIIYYSIDKHYNFKRK